MSAAAKKRNEREGAETFEAELPRSIGAVTTDLRAPAAAYGEVDDCQREVAQQRGGVGGWDARRQIDAADEEIDERALVVLELPPR
jgi:hypothetical protein